jgi:Spy/CpxP family protein refolding chaperone
MNSLRCLVGLAVLAALAAVSAAAGEGGARRGAGREPAESQYDLMARELKPTEQQQAQLKEKIAARDAALAAWTTANAAKVKAAEDAVKAARGGTDADAKKKAADDMKAIRAERDKATAEADAAVLAVLTAEQKTAWDTFKLYQTTVAKYKKITLTEEQSAKIKAACAAAWKELEANQGDDRAEKRARSDVNGKLTWAIEVVIA